MSKFRNYDNYEVYEDGKIYSYKSKKFLKPGTNKDGYQVVCLVDNEGNKKWYQVHRVVYEAVTGEPIPNDLQVNHRSEVKTENMISNLELVSPKENCNYGSRNAMISKANTNNPKISKALTNNPKISKSVGAYKDGKLVMTFPSTSEAQRQGYSSGHVSACCNGKIKSHKGYEWKYI